MVLGLIGAAAGTALGGAIDSVFNKAAADQEYEYNRRMQEDDQDFQREMFDKQVDLSNTAYQRGMEDMKKAGLNANLAFAQGGGSAASTPSGAGSASGGGVRVNSAAGSANTALMAKQIENMDADSNVKNTQAGLNDLEKTLKPQITKAQVALAQATTDKTRQETLTELAKTMAMEFQNRMTQMDIRKRDSQFDRELELYKAEVSGMLTEAGFDNSTAGALIKGIGKAVNAISPFIGMTGRSSSQQTAYSNSNSNIVMWKGN